MSIASTMCWQPCLPIAPPMTVASVQNATARAPLMQPRAVNTPLPSRALDRRQGGRVEQLLQPHLGVARIAVVDDAGVR